MNDLVREKLRELIITYGTSLANDPKRLEGLLKDYCGSYRKEVNALVSAAEERIPGEIIAAGNGMSLEVLALRLTRRMKDELNYTEEAARWAVESWAIVLGRKITSILLEEKQTPLIHKSVEPIQKLEDSKADIIVNSGGESIPFSWKSVFIYFLRIALILGVIGIGIAVFQIEGIMTDLTMGKYLAYHPIEDKMIDSTIGKYLMYHPGSDQVHVGIYDASMRLFTYLAFYIIVVFGFRFITRTFTGKRTTKDLGMFFLSISVIGPMLIIRNVTLWDYSGYSMFANVSASLLFGLLISCRIKNFAIWSGLILCEDYIWLLDGSRLAIQGLREIYYYFIALFLIVLIGGLINKQRLQIINDKGKENFINLGWLPVRIGNDKNKCDFWVASPTPVAFRFYRKNKQYFVKDEIGNTEQLAQPGDQIQIGNTVVIVR